MQFKQMFVTAVCALLLLKLKWPKSKHSHAKIICKFSQQQLVMVNYVCDFDQSDTGKYFE